LPAMPGPHPQGPPMQDAIRGRPQAVQVSWRAIYWAKDGRGQSADRRGTTCSMAGVDVLGAVVAIFRRNGGTDPTATI